MSKVSVFVSSTYLNLKEVRDVVRRFLEDRCFDAICFERGGVFFDPDKSSEQSCYDAVKKASLYLLIIGGRYGSESKIKPRNGRRTVNSITAREYYTAAQNNIPAFVYVDKSVLSEYYSYVKDGRRRNRIFAYVDNPKIFDLLDTLYKRKVGEFIQTYEVADDIKGHIQLQLNGLLERYLEARTVCTSTPKVEVRVDSFELFYHRHSRGLSFSALSQISGLDRNLLRGLERLRTRGKAFKENSFPSVNLQIVQRLEASLNCEGVLIYKGDKYQNPKTIEYYRLLKGDKMDNPETPPLLPFETKAVFFDFDGTLTTPVPHTTTWERIWELLGYVNNECAYFHGQFSKRQIEHQEWCDITSDYFQRKSFTQDHLRDIAEGITLIEGARDVILDLYSKNVKLYIVSGSIRQIIKACLGDLSNCFEDIKANSMEFDRDGKLSRIIGTKYDFEGKARFISRTIDELSISHIEALFVGNSLNDVHAGRSGVRTLCVNPHFIDGYNIKYWTHCIHPMKDFREVLRFVKLPDFVDRKEA